MVNRKLLWGLPIAAVAAGIYVLSSSETEPVQIQPLPQAVAEEPPAEPEPLLEPQPEPEETKPKTKVRSRGKRAVVPNAQFVIADDEDKPSLSDSKFYSALDGWRGVRTCLAESGGSRDSGAIRLRFKIAPNGEVKRTVAYDTEGPGAERIRNCVERQALAVKFPSFGGKDEIEKDATFVF